MTPLYSHDKEIEAVKINPELKSRRNSLEDLAKNGFWLLDRSQVSEKYPDGKASIALPARGPWNGYDR